MTITVCAYNRPEYLMEVLRSISTAIEVSKASADDTRVIIGIDPGGDRQSLVEDVARHWGVVTPDDVIVWPEHLGVSEHPRRLLQYVFTEVESEFNLHLEDDTVISPDAINLCQWFDMHRSRHLNKDNFTIGNCGLSLHSSEPNLTNNTDLVFYRKDFGVWGWACHMDVWEYYIAPFWNHKRTLPTGWDWSMTDTMRRLDLHMFCPALPRVHNIGREGGVHETPSGYDDNHANAVWAGPGDVKQPHEFHL